MATDSIPPADDPELLAEDAAAELLGVNPDRIAMLVESGLLTPVDEGPVRRFSAAEVRALRLQGG